MPRRHILTYIIIIMIYFVPGIFHRHRKRFKNYTNGSSFVVVWYQPNLPIFLSFTLLTPGYGCPSTSETTLKYIGKWHNHTKAKRHKTLHTFYGVVLTISNIEGILPKGPYLPCLCMADRALLAGYPRYMRSRMYFREKVFPYDFFLVIHQFHALCSIA